jgi:prevent-host-death family protein
MTRDLSIAHARNRLAALVREVEQGQLVRLTRRGQPVAVLLSLREYERLGPRRPDLWMAIEAFRRQRDLRHLDVDEIFDGVRDVPPDAR